MMTDRDVSNLFTAVKNQTSLESLQDFIQIFDPQIHEVKDGDGLNVLQRAIVENHIELVQYLLIRNYFNQCGQASVVPKCNNYMHLAVQLDRVGVLRVLLEHRPDDVIVRGTVCYPEQCTCLVDVDQETYDLAERANVDEPLGLTPLDFAIKLKNIKCLKLLLDSNSTLERACEINSPDALRVLLTETQVEKVLVDAFEHAVKKKLSACMDCLLEHGVPMDTVFRGLNCFHVMYQYTSSYIYKPSKTLTTASKEFGLLKSTQVLISHGHDVQANEPRNSYPLYSLLYMMFSDFCNEPDSEHVETIELLLRAGADPNFDEINLEDENPRCFVPVTYGREPYASALHAIQFDVFYPGVTMNHTSAVLKLLFKYGADPYKKCSSSGLLPLAQFLNRFCDVDYDDYLIIQEDSPMEKGDVAKALGDVLSIYYLNMNLPSFTAAIEQSGIRDKLQMFDIIGNITTDVLRMLCGQPKTLNDLAKLAVWEAIGRSALNMFILQKNVPPVLIKSVRRLFE